MPREFTSGIPTPTYLSIDNHRLYLLEEWAPLLATLNTNLIHSIQLISASHPFVERLVGTIRRAYLDQLLYWNSQDLQPTLEQIQEYFNEHRVHAEIDDILVNRRADEKEPKIARFESYS